MGIEIGSHISELVVNRLNKIIDGENSGISKSVGWKGGGNFAFLIRNKTKLNNCYEEICTLFGYYGV